MGASGIWLLCDYGEVLCTAPSAEDRARLEELAGGERDGLWENYWAQRLAYDRGDLTSAGYWTAVLGRAADPELLGRLFDADLAGWLHPNHEVLAATRRAAAAGVGLAILSNAPADHAAVYDRTEWLAPFSPRLFSGNLRLVKPEPAIFAAALHALGAQPGDVVFLDDRPANVDGARAAGIAAELFRDAAQIDEIAAVLAGRLRG
jgi:putative hydrolase of the HAD superfamily